MEVEPQNSSALHVDVLPLPPSEEDSNHCNGTNNNQLESDSRTADSLADGTLSPTSLRRSTRVSALKAQKKLKTKDGEMVEGQRTASVSPRENAAATTAGHATKDLSTTKAAVKRKLLKRKLSGGGELDQYDCKFGIRLDSHGDVYVMSDESEISSLNDEEVGELRQRYDSWLKQDVSEEVKEQRRNQLRELDVLLQQEEASLALMRKLRAHQVKATMDNAKRLPTATAVGQNASGANAYKPAMATLPANHNAKLNGTNHNKANNRGSANRTTANAQQTGASLPKLTPQLQQMLSALLAKASTPQQITQVMKSNVVSQLIQANMHHQQQQQQQSQATTSSRQSQSQQSSRQLQQQQQQQAAAAAALAQQQQQQQQAVAAAAAAAAQAKSQAVAKAAAEALAARVAEVQNINAQRIASARIQLRRYMEQQLQQLSMPKPPAPELNFVPNANQPDFYTMLGLDLVVQRVRKDKTVYKKWESEPYVCEQCATDFTPAWEAIEGNNGEYHLYCRQCVRQAQKRKNRTEHNNMYKSAFARIKDQEKEFEKQAAAGKFSEPIPTTIPGTNTTNSVSTSTVASTAAATTPSAAVTNRSTTAQQQQQSGGSHHYHQTGGSTSVQPQSHHQPHYSQQSGAARNIQQQSSSSGASTPQRSAQNLTKKRTTTATSSSGGGAAGSGGTSNNAMNALRNNPLFAMLNSPMLAQNLLQLMSQQQQRSGQGANNNNAALLSLMAQMAQASQSSQQQHSSSRQLAGGNSSGRSDGGASAAAAAAAAMNPNLWALNTQLNASALLNSPQLQEHMRQLQAQTTKSSKK